MNILSKEALQSILRATPDLYVLLSSSAPHFTILEASDSYLKATFTVREEIIGRGLFDVFPDYQQELR
jgi:two-component system sensor histidine kinase VicK